jgi:large subunit ribosomal protein L11
MAVPSKSKQITGYIKLQIPATKANPSPPVGPALGQRGLNIMDFCKQFNESSKEFEAGMPIPTVITVFADRSFSFIMKTPPTSFLIKKKIRLKKGSGTTGRAFIGKINQKLIREIAEIKIKDLGVSIEAAMSMVAGTAKSMGVQVVD